MVTSEASDELQVAVTGEDGRVFLAVRAQPGAKRSAVLGMHGGRLRIAVQAPPVDGKANTALLSWLAEVLQVPARQVILAGGQGSRDKRVEIQASRAQVLERLRTECLKGQTSRN
jgi:uncharacterized protein (TIGR00251 family)